MSSVPKAPFRALFSNDTTNITTCTSPYHRKGEPFRQEMLEASVDETAGRGVDVHMIQPGVAVVPWWKSRQYPYEEHVQWFEETYDVDIRSNPYAQYMLTGGDIVQACVNRCRRRGLAPFVSLRMNDPHGKEFVDGGTGSDIPEIPGLAAHCINRLYREHPEYRIGTEVDMAHWGTRVLSWIHPEVREWMFGFVREICEGYDIDGLELDFMRHFNYFRDGEATREQRVSIMTEFVSRTRDALDRTAKPGQHRWLCARVPCCLALMDTLGLDMPALVEAGLDMVNLSPSYYTVQQTDLRQIRRLAPDAALYLEMCHTTMLRGMDSGGYDDFLFRRTTGEQYYTAAHLAYARGADGVSFFNFVYYREHGVGERGPFYEPPFDVFENIGDPAWVARQPQHYFIGHNDTPPVSDTLKMPRSVEPGQTSTFGLDMAPPAGGWKQDGRLRIQAESDLGETRWKSMMNSVELEETQDRSEPYENPYPPLLGTHEEHRAWIVPRAILKDGTNMVEVTMTEGENATELVFLDLALE